MADGDVSGWDAEGRRAGADGSRPSFEQPAESTEPAWSAPTLPDARYPWPAGDPPAVPWAAPGSVPLSPTGSAGLTPRSPRRPRAAAVVGIAALTALVIGGGAGLRRGPAGRPRQPVRCRSGLVDVGGTHGARPTQRLVGQSGPAAAGAEYEHRRGGPPGTPGHSHDRGRPRHRLRIRDRCGGPRDDQQPRGGRSGRRGQDQRRLRRRSPDHRHPGRPEPVLRHGGDQGQGDRRPAPTSAGRLRPGRGRRAGDRGRFAARPAGHG